VAPGDSDEPLVVVMFGASLLAELIHDLGYDLAD